MLKDEYRDDLTLEDGVRLAVKCLVKALQERQLPLRIKIAVIPKATKTMEMLPDKTVEDYVKETSN
jgi:20S proteasome alpha/beta subunit